MKLSHYTIRNLVIPLLLILLVWAGIFYVLIMHEVNDETNDTLENYKELIIRKALTDPDFDRMHADEMTRYRMREVRPEDACLSENLFYDSTTYIELELEFEPVRVLKTWFMDAQGRCFELEIETSTLEKQDLVTTIFWSIVLLYLVLLVGILLVTHWVFKKSFNPLYGLLKWIQRFHPGKKTDDYVMDSKVDEFVALNNAVVSSMNRNREIYNQQKQFVENAAHELQTPLAIATNKLELLSENPDCTEEQLNEIGSIYETLRWIIKMNKSLLLLSRIENKQYPETSPVNLNELTREIIDTFTEIYENKQLRVVFEEKNPLQREMNESLARVLLSNLLKNAFIHNYPGGEIHVVIDQNTLKIWNTSQITSLEGDALYARFNKKSTSKESTGLGLAIVKSITQLYDIRIAYQYDGKYHVFTLFF